MAADGNTLGLCPDWVYSSGSNVSVTKDRGWFTEYTPFESELDSLLGGVPIKIAGIGTVEIPTKRTPNIRGASAKGTLKLTEVLHAPTVLCNILGNDLAMLHDYTIFGSGGKKSKGSIKDGDGKNLAYFDPKHAFWAVKVRGPPTGPILAPSVFKPHDNTAYVLSVRWEDSERERWMQFKDDERAQGRRILRAMMEEDQENEEAEEDDESDVELDGQQLTDHLFDADDLAWIKENFGNSMNFMLAHGLKFYDNDDCREAVATVKCLRAPDE